jgi:hypothetical protein
MVNRKNEERVEDDYYIFKKKQNSRFNEKGSKNKRKDKKIKKIGRHRKFNDILFSKKKYEFFTFFEKILLKKRK